MDTFVEQIIKKKKQLIDWLIIVGIFLLAVVIAVFVFTKISILIPMLVLVFWGAWWVATNRNQEFEYSITNGEMDIDCIIAQRRRKRLCSITCAKVESYGKLANADMTGKQFERTIMAAPAANMQDNFYFVYRSKKYGRTLVVFHPDERVQKAFYNALPRSMQMQVK